MKDSESSIRAQVHRHVSESRVQSQARQTSQQSGQSRSLLGILQQTDQGRHDFARNRKDADDAVRREIEKGRKESAATRRQGDHGRSETQEHLKKQLRP
jgi:hypothetical protein